jgi:hypothetical protein
MLILKLSKSKACVKSFLVSFGVLEILSRSSMVQGYCGAADLGWNDGNRGVE